MMEKLGVKETRMDYLEYLEYLYSKQDAEYLMFLKFLRNGVEDGYRIERIFTYFDSQHHPLIVEKLMLHAEMEKEAALKKGAKPRKKATPK